MKSEDLGWGLLEGLDKEYNLVISDVFSLEVNVL